MADNILVNEGSGRSIATDEIAGISFQLMKLVDGTDESTTPIPGTSQLGLFVDPHASTVRKTALPTISTSVYASGDVIGTKMTFTDCARVSGGSGILQSIMLIDLAKQDAKIDLVLFNQDFTSFGADNAVAAVVDADLANVIGVVTFDSTAPSDYSDTMPATNGSSVGQKHNLGIPFVLSGTTNIYAQMIVRGAPTYVSTGDLRVILTVLQD